MGFQYDATGVDAEGGFPLLPDGKWFPFKIIDVEEKTSKSGNPMVQVDCVVVDYPQYDGSKVRHWVTFLPKESKGAGIAVHWLKSIAQPFEGQFEVEPEMWVGAKFMGRVIVSEYNGKKNNKLSEISPYKPGATQEAPEPVEDKAPWD